jgi:hypothetical protein
MTSMARVPSTVRQVAGIASIAWTFCACSRLRSADVNSLPVERNPPAASAAVESATPPAASAPPSSSPAAVTSLNTADTAWSLAQLRASASPEAGPAVWLEGYVNLADCSYGRQDAPQPCLFASFADHPFAGGIERVLLGGVPDSWQQLRARSRVRVLITYDKTLKGPLNFAPGEEALNYVDELAPRELAVEHKAGSFADGSWSVSDLLTWDGLHLEMSLDVTGYVIASYECPRCPRPAKCRPCGAPFVTLADTPDASTGPSLVVAGFAGPRLPKKYDPRRRYKFSGVWRESVSAVSTERGGLLGI